jgi:hypothetical protein
MVVGDMTHNSWGTWQVLFKSFPVGIVPVGFYLNRFWFESFLLAMVLTKSPMLSLVGADRFRD